MERDKVEQKISECRTVIQDLQDTKAWQVVQKDMNEQKGMIDSNWQDVFDEKKLLALRALKNATKHVLSLKQKYQDDLETALSELKMIDNPDQYVEKDYDMETKLED